MYDIQIILIYQLNCYYPMRNQVSLELTMRDVKNLLVKDSADANNYKLHISSLRLRLVYSEFEIRIRER